MVANLQPDLPCCALLVWFELDFKNNSRETFGSTF